MAQLHRSYVRSEAHAREKPVGKGVPNGDNLQFLHIFQILHTAMVCTIRRSYIQVVQAVPSYIS